MAKNITPRVSAVMSVFNAGNYVASAVQSILSQDFDDFELIIINDGSTDNTAAVLKRFNDRRIRLFTQSNHGLVASLNRAISLARGSLIARHDADDYSLPDRFTAQIELLEQHPELILAGSSMQVMDASGTYLHNHMVLLQDAELKQELLVRSPFAHGSVMFRKEMFDKAGGYKQSEWPAEDYGLWLRMAHFGAFANVDAPLYRYRENELGISVLNARKQSDQTRAIRTKAWRLRAQLLPKNIQITPYLKLSMGQQRIERIAANLLFSASAALKKGDLLTAAKSLRPIIINRHLLRKCVRIALISTRIKHV